MVSSTEGAVLLDVAPILVGRRGADAPQLAAGQRRLHHARGVESAHGPTRPDHTVDLVDKDDDVALGALDLFHGRL
jgi:hypothetical protein